MENTDTAKLRRIDPIIKARRNPTSRSLALKAYFWDLEGIELNRGCSGFPAKEAKEAARSAYRDARGKGLKRAIEEICYTCVGGDADPEPHPKIRVRDCGSDTCLLWPVRPWQDRVGRGRYRKDAKDAEDGQKSAGSAELG
jgi:hypothetical protein